MMAAWSNDYDIACDLNKLSEFKSSSDAKVKSYTSSWGRGKVKLEGSDMPEAPIPQTNHSDEFKWFQEKPIGKLPDSLSRGKKLEILKENCCFKGKEFEVREQLRAAIGPGYSNELIEASFKSRLEPSGANGAFHKQFDDSEEDNTLKAHDNSIQKAADESSKDITDPVSNKILKRRKRYPNAVLESLERRNYASEDTDNLVDTSPQFSDTSLQTKTQESTLKNVPPACYVPFRKKTNAFEYCEEEFPKL